MIICHHRYFYIIWVWTFGQGCVCVCVCMLFKKNMRRKRQREKGSVSEYNRCVICSNNTWTFELELRWIGSHIWHGMFWKWWDSNMKYFHLIHWKSVNSTNVVFSLVSGYNLVTPRFGMCWNIIVLKYETICALANLQKWMGGSPEVS